MTIADPPGKAGGFHSIAYTLKMARKSGSFKEFYRVLKSKNTCKACALGMKGLENEIDQGGVFDIQVCKKSMQAVAQDLLGGIEPSFWSNHPIKELGSMRGMQLEAAGRLVDPLIARKGSSHFEIISWSEAYEILLDHMRSADPNRAYFYASGRSSNEAAFLFQILSRQYGMNNVSNCSYYCHQASGVGLKQSIGSGTSTVMLEDVEKADMVVLIGANPSSNHPRFITHLVRVRKRGGKVVVVNPMREVGLEYFKIPSKIPSLLLGSKVSDLYLQPHCGGDMSLLKALAIKIMQNREYDKDFLTSFCDGWEEFKHDLENSDFDTLLLQSGVAQQEFNQFYRMLVSHKNVIFAWAMGVTHHKHGVETVRMIANIQFMLGNIGREGAGLLPLRGHSNVQGVGSVGVYPRLPPKIVDLIAEHLHISIPENEGKDTFAVMEAAHNEQMDFGLHLGGNLYGANPASNWAEQALSKLEFTAFISTTLNLGHIHGRGKTSLILPVRTRDEEKQPTTQESMFNYVRISEGGFDAPVPGLPTEVELISYLGNQLFGDDPINWAEFEDHNRIREYISLTIPSLQPLRDLKSEDSEFTIPGRIKHTPEFATDTGNAKLFIGQPPDTRPPNGSFNLLTFRSEGQFNTIVYEEEDAYRGVDHRQVLFINRRDLEQYGLEDGEWVTVKSKAGELQVQLAEAPIRASNVAMYFPEGNVLCTPEVDPQSRTPSFKRTLVELTKIS